MKKRFFYKVLFFLVPIMLIIIGIEYYFRYSENAFTVKASYFQKNKSNVEVLIFGSSHSQNGINPEYFSENTSSLAYAAQDIKIDSALLFHNVKQMKNLKKVIFELDYHRMDTENAKTYSKLPWYYIFYGVEIDEIRWVNKISLYSSDPNFFNNLIITGLKGKHKGQVINEFGYVQKNFQSKFLELNHDSLQIELTAKERLKGRHTEQIDEVFENNKKRIFSIVDYCKKNNIQLYFVSSPLFSSYRKLMLPEKIVKMDSFIRQLQEKEGVKYYNFVSDPRFKLKDYADDDHLNPDGAKKYSMILDSIIRN